MSVCVARGEAKRTVGKGCSNGTTLVDEAPDQAYGWVMTEPIRVMLERGKKKRVAASDFDWPGWDRSTKLGGDVLAVLDSYRYRFAKVAELAGYGDEFGRLGDLEVVEQVEGIGMTDYYGVSGRAATAEGGPMTEAELDRKLAAASGLVDHLR